jgi:hypothetical protein
MGRNFIRLRLLNIPLCHLEVPGSELEAFHSNDKTVAPPKYGSYSSSVKIFIILIKKMTVRHLAVYGFPAPIRFPIDCENPVTNGCPPVSKLAFVLKSATKSG